MKARLKSPSPNGQPVSLGPTAGFWQGYERPPEVSLPEAFRSVSIHASLSSASKENAYPYLRRSSSRRPCAAC